MKSPRWRLIFLVLFSVAPGTVSAAHIHFLPAFRLYQQYYADALAHQLSLSKHFESTEWFADIGASVPLADIFLGHRQMQLSAGATVFNTIVKTPGHIQVYTVDYLVDASMDMELGASYVGGFILGHLSAHYADDGIVELHRLPINYVRDYIGIHCRRTVPFITGSVYAGGFYMYHNEPDASRRFTVQIGGDAQFFRCGHLGCYAAADLKIKSEVNFGTTQSLQVGVRFFHPSSTRSIRLALTHRRGYEERGQLYDHSEVKNSLGIFIDL